MNKKTVDTNDVENITFSSALEHIISALHGNDADVVIALCEDYLVKAKSIEASASEPVIRLLKNTRIAPDGKRWNNLYIQVRNGSPISIDLVGKTRSNWKIRNLLLAHATEFTPTWAFKQAEPANTVNGPSWEPPVEEEDNDIPEAE